MRLDASYVARSSAGRVLWFGFPSLGEPDAAELTVMRYDGKVLGRIDLLKATGFATSAEFKANVAYHDLGVPGEGGWVPLDTVQNYGGNMAERIEMRGENRRYILVVDDSKARLETYRGLEARRPKEGIWPNAKILAERRFDSPNGRFRLRERRVKNPNGSDYFFVTFLGKAHVAYRPNGRVVGISKLSRLVDGYARRLQLQERLTNQIARALDDVLRPRGVAVIIEASHGCMSTRGVNQHGVAMVTKCWLGEFKADAELRRQLMASIRLNCG